MFIKKNLKFNLEIFNESNTPWASIKSEIMKIEQAAFGDKSDSEEMMEKCFTNPKIVAVFLRDAKTEQMVGYSYAIPDPQAKSKKVALVDSTAILPSHQGKGLVGGMNKLLENELIKRGYRYITERANVANGYADKIEKVYADRLMEKYDVDSIYGKQRYFKIKLIV